MEKHRFKKNPNKDTTIKQRERGSLLKLNQAKGLTSPEFVQTGENNSTLEDDEHKKNMSHTILQYLKIRHKIQHNITIRQN